MKLNNSIFSLLLPLTVIALSVYPDSGQASSDVYYGAPIKQPQTWQIAGYYSTRYCIRFHQRANKYTVSLEGFENRKAE